MDGITVWAMLLPLQMVIALAGVFAGIHLFQRSEHAWMAVGGIMFPVVSVMISLLLGL